MPESFSQAEDQKIFTVEGQDGYFKKVTQSEGTKCPDSIRAIAGGKVCFFVPLLFSQLVSDEEV